MPHRRKKPNKPAPDATPATTAAAATTPAIVAAAPVPGKPVTAPVAAASPAVQSALSTAAPAIDLTSLSSAVHSVMLEIGIPKPLIAIVVSYVPRSVLLVLAGTNWGHGHMPFDLEPIGPPGRPRQPIYRTDGIWRHVLKYDPGTIVTGAKAGPDAADDESYLTRGMWSVVDPTQLLTPDMRTERQTTLEVPSACNVGDRHVVLYDGERRSWIMPLACAGQRASEATAPAAADSDQIVKRIAAAIRIVGTPALEAKAVSGWSLLAKYPNARPDDYWERGFAVWAGRCMYSFHSYEREGEYYRKDLDAVEKGRRAVDTLRGRSHMRRYDTVEKAWHSMGYMETGLTRGMITVFGRWIVGIGPYSVSVIDTATNKEIRPSPVPAIPDAGHGVKDAACVTWNGSIVLTGGRAKPDVASVRAACWIWTPKARNAWIRHSLLQIARDRHAIAVLNDTIWVMGGRDESGDPLDSVEYWDHESKRWRFAAPMCEPRISPCVITWN